MDHRFNKFFKRLAYVAGDMPRTILFSLAGVAVLMTSLSGSIRAGIMTFDFITDYGVKEAELVLTLPAVSLADIQSFTFLPSNDLGLTTEPYYPYEMTGGFSVPPTQPPLPPRRAYIRRREDWLDCYRLRRTRFRSLL